MTDDERFERLRDRLSELHAKSPALARQLGDLDLRAFALDLTSRLPRCA